MLFERVKVKMGALDEVEGLHGIHEIEWGEFFPGY
jgi:hypothetical protein